MIGSQLIFVVIFIAISRSNCLVKLKEGFLNTDRGEAEFGVPNNVEATKADCGRKTTLNRCNLEDICIATLGRNDNDPEIVNSVTKVGDHTVFKLVAEPGIDERLVRLVGERGGNTETQYYVSPSNPARIEFCTNNVNVCDILTFNIEAVSLVIDESFFTDFKLHIGSGETIGTTCSPPPDCSSSLCLRIALADKDSCGSCNAGYFGIRTSPDNTGNVFRTVRVDVKILGSYGTVGTSKDHFYYIDDANLQPLITAAQCGSHCVDSQGLAFCHSEAACPVRTSFTNFNANRASMIADHTYMTYHGCSDSPKTLSSLLCGVLKSKYPDAVASENIIFDPNGNPHCDCEVGYSWDPRKQYCLKDVRMSKSDCATFCGLHCQENEVCAVDNDFIEKCECKENWTRLSKHGRCQPHLDCTNGTLVRSQGKISCRCRCGYRQLVEDGPCVPKAVSMCEIYPRIICPRSGNAAFICECPDGSIIAPGSVCPVWPSCTEPNEETVIDPLGATECTCVDAYTKGNSDDMCFTCATPYTVKYDTGVFSCHCSEGFIPQRDGTCTDAGRAPELCPFGDGWDFAIQACESCGPHSSSHNQYECANSCEGRCNPDEDCVIGDNGIEKCECRGELIRFSKHGRCKRKPNYENGYMTVKYGEFVYVCNSGYRQLEDDGPCVSDERITCHNDLQDCEIGNNDSACICATGTAIPSGMCRSTECDCSEIEECSVNGLGDIICACSTYHTRVLYEDTCFGILYCNPQESLTYDTESQLDCHCKEGTIEFSFEDEMYCLDNVYFKFCNVHFIAYFLVLVLTLS